MPLAELERHCDVVLNRTFRQLKESSHKILLVMDDMNTLYKKKLRNEEQIDLDTHKYREMVSQQLVNLSYMNDKNHPLCNVRRSNLILLVAASQHFSFFVKMGGSDPSKRIQPTNDVWDIVGYYYFFTLAMKDNPQLNSDWRPKTCQRIVCSLLQESGMLPRAIVVGINSGTETVQDRSDTSRNLKYIVHSFVEGMRTQVRQHIETRYSEVFENYYFKKGYQPNKVYQKFTAAQRKVAHKEFVRDTLNLLLSHSFKIDTHVSPYLDTGLVLKCEFSGSHGFISRMARVEFGSVIGFNEKLQRSITEINHSGQAQDFEKAVQNGIILRGICTSKVVAYESGKVVTLDPVSDAPSPCRRYFVTFHVMSDEEKTCKLRFSSDEEEQDFRSWMREKSMISESVLFISCVSGGGQMPGFDQILVFKEVSSARRCTHLYLLQCSLEDGKDSVISSERFTKISTNGIKVLQNVVDAVWPELQYKVALSKERKKFYVIKNTKGDELENLNIEVFYVCLRSEVKSRNPENDPLKVWVYNREACEDNFMVTWRG